MSVTAATGRGVAGLVKDAERGEDIIIERHGRAVAAVVSVEHFDELRLVRADLNAAALVLAHRVGTRALALKVEYRFKQLTKRHKEAIVRAGTLRFDRTTGRILGSPPRVIRP